jgi:hypothetical protein
MIAISVVPGDALGFSADVLALKFAQDLYGVDLKAHARFMQDGRTLRLPAPGGSTLQESPRSIAAGKVLFLGVAPLYQFGYASIRDFGRRALEVLATEAPTTRHLALTVHGPGYGLDEAEAFESELAGVIDAIRAGTFPRSLEKVSFVEYLPERASRLSSALARLVPTGWLTLGQRGDLRPLANEAQHALRSAGNPAAAKPHVFVAMPFVPDMDDIFHYGIQGAVNAAGLLCERADLSHFTGDVMDWVKRRLSTAKLVVADLSSANPNVYLEVGYAWGRDVPTVLIARHGTDLTFDVRGHKCMFYKSIKHLEEALAGEIRALS